MTRYGCVAAMVLAGVAWGAGPATVKSPEVRLCEKAGVHWHAGALVHWLQVRSDAKVAGQVKKWVARLGDEAFAVREEASAKLKLLGEAALPELERARTTADDLETRRRAERLIRTIEAGRPDRLFLRPLDWAVVRLLGRTGTTREAAAALVAYVPCASEDETIEALYEALDRLHSRGLAGEALRGALKSEHAGTRALAGCVLGKSDEAAEREAVRPLLKDRDPEVRLRTAQGLLAAMKPEREALPVLVELLGEKSRAVAWQAEELLRFAAGASSPEEVLGSHEAKRRERVRAAWRAWWRANATIDLTRLHASGRRPGLVMVQVGWVHGEVQVLGCEGKPRWIAKCANQNYITRTALRSNGDILEIVARNNLTVCRCDRDKQNILTKIEDAEMDGFRFWPNWDRKNRLVLFDNFKGLEIQLDKHIIQKFAFEDEVTTKSRFREWECPTIDIDGSYFFMGKLSQEGGCDDKLKKFCYRQNDRREDKNQILCSRPYKNRKIDLLHRLVVGHNQIVG